MLDYVVCGVILDPFLTAEGGGEGFCEGIMGQLYISAKMLFTDCLDSFLLCENAITN